MPAPVSGRSAEGSSGAVAPAPARLLDLRGVGAYLGGLSLDSVKKLDAEGRLPRVKIPGIRRVLVDRTLLDEAVTSWREAGAERG